MATRAPLPGLSRAIAFVLGSPRPRAAVTVALMPVWAAQAPEMMPAHRQEVGGRPVAGVLCCASALTPGLPHAGTIATARLATRPRRSQTGPIDQIQHSSPGLRDVAS